MGGDQDATSLIEGWTGSSQLHLEMDTPQFNFSNKTMIFVMMHEGNYFFVERQYPAPSCSTIYIVPFNKVKLATITKIKGPGREGYPPDYDFNKTHNMGEDLDRYLEKLASDFNKSSKDFNWQSAGYGILNSIKQFYNNSIGARKWAAERYL